MSTLLPVMKDEDGVVGVVLRVALVEFRNDTCRIAQNVIPGSTEFERDINRIGSRWYRGHDSDYDGAGCSGLLRKEIRTRG